MEKQPINFKQERDFNDLISNTVDFIKQEYKTLGKALLTYAGPFVLITAFLGAMYQNDLYSDPDTFNNNDPLKMLGNIYSTKYFLFMLGSIVSNVVLLSVVYSYVLLYVTKGKDGFEQEEISGLVIKNFVPVLLMIFVMSFMIGFGFIFLFVPGIYLAVVFSLVIYAKFAEDLSFGNAMSRSMYLIKDYWWFTFGVLIVVYIIAFVSGSIFLLPQVALSRFYTISMQAGDFEGTSMLFTIISAIGTFASTLLYSIVYITLTFHYYSQVEKKEKPNLMNKIDDIS
ncbi:MAG: hypothetical protein ABFS35_04990 [Bacteroidota bacterium]